MTNDFGTGWRVKALADPTFELSQKEVNLLGEGPKSLAQAWHLQALKIRFLTHGTGTGTMRSGPGNE